MHKISEFAIDNSRATILALVFIVLIGVNTFLTMPSQEDPEITIRNAQVSAYFPGMPPDQIENLIAKPLEKKIKEIPEIKSVETTIKTGEVLIQPKVYDTYFDLAPIWQDLRNKMDDIKSDLPQGTVGPDVNDDFGRVSVATIAMTGDGFSMREMRDVAFHLQDKIGAVNSVSKVQLLGIQPERIYLDINAARLSQYGVVFSELIATLNSQNVVLSGGSLNAEGRVIGIEPTGDFQSIDEIRNIQVQAPDSEQVIYLQDIADVRRDYVDPAQFSVFYNDKPAVILAVSMVPQYNIMDFGDEITAKVSELQLELPIGLDLDYATYQPTLVERSIDSAVNNLYQTVAVVLVVVILFLGLRTGLIVSAIVPLTILMSFIAMNLWGIDLQRMSIAAIIISLGLLVDNGIVIAEDMRRRMDEGEDKKSAAMMAAKSLGVPLFTSSLTTIFAFMPLMLADDVSGEYLRSLSQVIITTLLSSWFLAMFATPALCYWFLSDKAAPKAKDEGESNNTAMHSVYRKFLEIVLNLRLPFVGVMVALLVVSVMGLAVIPKQMMPYSDRNQFLVYLDFPAGTYVDETESVTRRLTTWLADTEANPDVESAAAYIGFGGPRFFLSLSPPNPGSNVAFLVVNTTTTEDVLPVSQRVDRFIADNLPEASGRSKRMSLGASEIGLVEYRIVGSEITELFQVGRIIKEEMQSIPGSVGITDDWGEPIIRMKVNVDQERARRAGVTSQSIAETLSSYFDGVSVSGYREGDKTIPIVVRGDAARNDWAELRVLPILSDQGEPVPLVQVADFEAYVAPGKFARYDQERTLTVSGKHRALQATDFHLQIWPFIQNLDLPDGVRIEIGGEVESSAEGNEALAANLPFALIGITVLLVLQFNSLRRPAIIMLTIPLVVIGAVMGLMLSNAFFSFTALLGIYSLVGIIVNNGIVLIDRIDIERATGKGVRDSLIEACLARMRPILMTTLTTILGLIPMALFGGPMWFPMAVAIMGGLAVGSVLTLGFVPVLYSLFFKEEPLPAAKPA